MGLSGHGIPSGIVPFVPVVCGASYHLLGYRISQDSKIRFRLQVESYIGDWLFSESQLLASYVSRHKAMAYDNALRLLICNLKLKLIISKQRVSSSVPLQLIEKAPLLV